MSVSDSTVSAAVAHAVAARCREVFGVMGNGNAWFLDAVAATPARFTAVRHEAGAVMAADAYARVSGRIAVATSTYGPGFANTVSALAEAAQARIPLLLVSGDRPSAGPRPWDVDQVGLAAAVGVPTVVVDDRTPLQTTLDALARAARERRPVVVAIPYDLAAARAADEPAPTAAGPITARPLDAAAEAALDRVATLLASAQRPHVLAGRGAWLAGAGAALDRLAATAGATTSSSALARGIFADAARDLGVTGGFGDPAAMATILRADVVVVVGASFTPFTTRFGELFGPEAHVVQIDVAPEATDGRVDEFVRADARLAAGALADRLGRGGSATRPVPARASSEPVAHPELAADGRLDPRALAARLAGLLPDDRVVLSDGGHFMGWANSFWPVASPDRMVMVGTAFQAIGTGFPSVAGAARARPESTIVLSAGDGGSLMALAELETAVRVAGGHGLAVIWNDAAYGAEVHAYGTQGLDEAAMRIPEADFAALADAVGGEGVVIRRLADLERLAAWRDEPAASRRLLLLDCRISPLVVADFWREVVAHAPQPRAAG